jgi:hypothetical protein
MLDRPGGRQHVALPRRGVGAPVLRVEAGRAGAIVAVDQHVPVERAGGCGAGPERAEVALHELDRVLLDAFGRLIVRLAVAVLEHAADVADRPRPVGWKPGLAREQVGHVAVGVERLDVAAGHGVLVEFPAELLGLAIGPQLEGLRTDRDRGLDAAPEALVARHQLPADVGQRTDRDAEHHLVEVAAALERMRRAPERIQLGFEVGPPGGGLELIPAGLAGPAGQVAHWLERVVLLDPGRQVGLAHDLDRVDAVAARVQGGDGVEELKAHAAAVEHLV